MKTFDLALTTQGISGQVVEINEAKGTVTLALANGCFLTLPRNEVHYLD